MKNNQKLEAKSVQKLKTAFDIDSSTKVEQKEKIQNITKSTLSAAKKDKK